jgi:D-alanyl-lipoteichoic acid acyltransferase DltB (MBOAT superfamily)
MELLGLALSALVGQIPMLLAYAVALIIVIMRWREAPRASLLALCGILFGLFLLVVMPFLFTWVPRRLNAGSSMTEISRIYTVLGIAGSIAHAISFGFLFMAIYAGRRSPGAPAQY